MRPRWRVAFWLRMFRLTNPWSAGVSMWCMERLAAAEADQWIQEVEQGA